MASQTLPFVYFQPIARTDEIGFRNGRSAIVGGENKAYPWDGISGFVPVRERTAQVSTDAGIGNTLAEALP
jgi:hypothetical protein